MAKNEGPKYITEAVINGKRVTLKKKLPVGDGYNLLEVLEKGGSQNYLEHIPALMMLIESWEFDGSPQDADAYKELDLFDEMMPLEQFVSAYITARMQAIAEKKN